MTGNRLCELVGIEYPIFQGGMAWVANASLASAVSNAGGLGIIAAMNSNAAQLRAEIEKCRAKTDKPFGVNVMLMSPFADEVAAVVAEERIAVVTTGAGNPSKVHGGLAGGRREGDPGRPVGRTGENGRAARRFRRDRRRRRVGRACRRPDDDGAGSAGVRRGGNPRHCGRRHRRRARRGSGLYAGRLRRAARHALPRRQGMHHPPELQGQGACRAATSTR